MVEDIFVVDLWRGAIYAAVPWFPPRWGRAWCALLCYWLPTAAPAPLLCRWPALTH